MLDSFRTEQAKLRRKCEMNRLMSARLRLSSRLLLHGFNVTASREELRLWICPACWRALTNPAKCFSCGWDYERDELVA